MVANVGYVMIGQDPLTKDFWIQQREDNDGKPGKVNLFADGSGDVRPSINNYVRNGYDPEKIIYNGQPVTDVFTKTTDENGDIVFKGRKKGKVEFAKDIPGVSQIITTTTGEKVPIPVYLGSQTYVKPLRNGMYKVVSRLVVNPPQKPSVTIMSEQELIEHFAKQAPKLDVKA